MKLSEIITRIIDTLRNKEQQADESAKNRIEHSLEKWLMTLSQDEFCWVEAVMYLGRDSEGTTTGLADRFDNLSSVYQGPDIDVDNMLGKAPLAKYLADGLAKLAQRSVDVDSLMTTFRNTPLASLNSGDGVTLHPGPPWYCDKCGQQIKILERF